MTEFCAGDLFMFVWCEVACNFARSFVVSVDHFFLEHGLLFLGCKAYFFNFLFLLFFHSVHPVTNMTLDMSSSVYMPYIT